MTVTDIIGEGISTHHIAEGAERQERIYHLIHQVGLKKEHASRYPHEFSPEDRGRGKELPVLWQWSRILVICDKPISGLDVSNQAQVVNMMLDLQEKMGLTYLFIAHDLSMGKYISDRIGRDVSEQLMEVTDSHELYKKTLHPYTKAPAFGNS